MNAAHEDERWTGGQTRAKLQTMHDLPIAHEPRSTATLPPGSGIAMIGVAMMVAGAFGPWIGGQFFGARTGIALGGDGWLVLGAATLALLPVVLRLAGAAMRGAWVIALGLAAGFVCWTHYTQANADGVNVVWGLELAGIGSVLLAFAGLRLLLDRS